MRKEILKTHHSSADVYLKSYFLPVDHEPSLLMPRYARSNHLVIKSTTTNESNKNTMSDTRTHIIAYNRLRAPRKAGNNPNLFQSSEMRRSRKLMGSSLRLINTLHLEKSVSLGSPHRQKTMATNSPTKVPVRRTVEATIFDLKSKVRPKVVQFNSVQGWSLSHELGCVYEDKFIYVALAAVIGTFHRSLSGEVTCRPWRPNEALRRSNSPSLVIPKCLLWVVIALKLGRLPRPKATGYLIMHEQQVGLYLEHYGRLITFVLSMYYPLLTAWPDCIRSAIFSLNEREEHLFLYVS